MQSTHQGKIR